MQNMYIPDAQKWIQYYKQIAKGTHRPYVNHQHRKTIQTGGSIGRKSIGFMDNIDVLSTPKDHTDSAADVNVQLVSPAQQSVEQVKSEIARKSNQKRTYKRRKILKNVSPRKRHKRTASPKKKIQVKKKKKTKHLTTKKKQSSKKKSFSDIFN